MQLVAYGAQDIYLTGNPQITFFKVVYRRHTNFSMETIQQTISGTSTLGTSESDGTVTISRNGDLVSKIFVSSTIADISDVSTHETLSRTLITSITTLLALFSIYIFGGAILKGFSFAMIVGVIVGTYSSIFVATPILNYTKVSQKTVLKENMENN